MANATATTAVTATEISIRSLKKKQKKSKRAKSFRVNKAINRMDEIGICPFWNQIHTVYALKNAYTISDYAWNGQFDDCGRLVGRSIERLV